jgi:hypothetical protein
VTASVGNASQSVFQVTDRVKDVRKVVESARELRNVVDAVKSAACEYGDKGHCRGFYASIQMRTGLFLVEMSQVARPRNREL